MRSCIAGRRRSASTSLTVWSNGAAPLVVAQQHRARPPPTSSRLKSPRGGRDEDEVGAAPRGRIRRRLRASAVADRRGKIAALAVRRDHRHAVWPPRLGAAPAAARSPAWRSADAAVAVRARSGPAPSGRPREPRQRALADRRCRVARRERRRRWRRASSPALRAGRREALDACRRARASVCSARWARFSRAL